MLLDTLYIWNPLSDQRNYQVSPKVLLNLNIELLPQPRELQWLSNLIKDLYISHPGPVVIITLPLRLLSIKFSMSALNT